MKMVNPNFIEVNEITDILGYLKSIDWYDPWLFALIAFHLLTTATTLVSRNHGHFQIVLFTVLLALVFFSEAINKYAAANWMHFSKQQYFDSNGFFISLIFSTPILLNCMLLIGRWLYQSFDLMTTLKTRQLRERIKRQKLYESNQAKIESESGEKTAESNEDVIVDSSKKND